VRQRDVWREAIPLDEATLAAEQLVKVWNMIAQSQQQHVKYSVSEPKLTERLHSYLSRLRGESGLLGFWSNEIQEAFYDAQGNLLDRTRKDITYQSNMSGKRLSLIFEFKKLTRASVRTYQGLKGMRRFVDGNYGNKEPLAAMVGMLKPGDTTAVQSLYRSLSNPRVRGQLCMVHDNKTRYIRQPSDVFPNLREAQFDTEHRRPAENAPPGGTTTLTHIFIEFV
jgi:hypothetical protein